MSTHSICRPSTRSQTATPVTMPKGNRNGSTTVSDNEGRHGDRSKSSTSTTGQATAQTPTPQVTDDKFTDMNNTLQLVLNQMSCLDTIKKDLHTLRDDFAETKANLAKVKGDFAKVDDLRVLRTSVGDHTDQLAGHQAELAGLRTEIKFLRSELVYIKHDFVVMQDQNAGREVTSKSKNLLIDGFAEKKEEVLREEILRLCRIIIPRMNDYDLDSIYRVGQYHKDRVRSVHVSFTRKCDRDKIYCSKNKIKDDDKYKNVWINDDVPSLVKSKHADLRAIGKHAKRMGKNVKLYPDAIIVEGEKFHVQDLDNMPEGLSISDAKVVKTKKGIAFQSKHAPFSNFYPSKIHIDSEFYCNAEQAFQHHKALHHSNNEIAGRIMMTRDPLKAKKLGDSIKGIKSWDTQKKAVMKKSCWQNLHKMWHSEKPSFRRTNSP